MDQITLSWKAGIVASGQDEQKALRAIRIRHIADTHRFNREDRLPLRESARSCGRSPITGSDYVHSAQVAGPSRPLPPKFPEQQ